MLLLPGLVRAEEKTFADKNFKLEASDSWQWMELSSDLESSGYVARLGRRAAGSVAVVDIRVVPTNGLPMDDLVQEVKDGLGASLQAVQGTKVMKGKLSGLACELVLLKGIDNRDSHVLIRAYNLEAGDTFHQMMFTHRRRGRDEAGQGDRRAAPRLPAAQGRGPVEEEAEGLDDGGCEERRRTTRAQDAPARAGADAGVPTPTTSSGPSRTGTLVRVDLRQPRPGHRGGHADPGPGAQGDPRGGRQGGEAGVQRGAA